MENNVKRTFFNKEGGLCFELEDGIIKALQRKHNNIFSIWLTSNEVEIIRKKDELTKELTKEPNKSLWQSIKDFF